MVLGNPDILSSGTLVKEFFFAEFFTSITNMEQLDFEKFEVRPTRKGIE